MESSQQESKDIISDMGTDSKGESPSPKTDEQLSLPSFGIKDPLHPNQSKTKPTGQSQTENYEDYVNRQKEVFAIEKNQESTPWMIFSELEDAEKQSDPFDEISISEDKFHNALASKLEISQDDVSKIINGMNLDKVCVEGKSWFYRRRGE